MSGMHCFEKQNRINYSTRIYTVVAQLIQKQCDASDHRRCVYDRYSAYKKIWNTVSFNGFSQSLLTSTCVKPTNGASGPGSNIVYSRKSVKALMQIHSATKRKFFIIIDEWDALFREAKQDKLFNENIYSCCAAYSKTM